MDLISCVLYNTHNHTFGCSLSLDKSKFNIYQSNQRTRGIHMEHRGSIKCTQIDEDPVIFFFMKGRLYWHINLGTDIYFVDLWFPCG